MVWMMSNRADPFCVAIADRHYSRQKPGTPQFVPPGTCQVFKGDGLLMTWVTSWPKAEFVKHAWAGAWVNTMFRKECPGIASDYILQAVAATRYEWPNTPDLGVVTFIDPKHVKPIKRRGVDVWGYSYLCAGFEHVGFTKSGKHALQLLPEDMPDPEPAIGARVRLSEALS